MMRRQKKNGRLCSAGMKLAMVTIFSFTVIAAALQPARDIAAETGGRQWRAVAPGHVEPASGDVSLMSAATGRVAEVLVSASDRVFAGELLIRLDAADARARLAKAQAQFAMQKRARNDEAVSGKAAQRRKAEDAAADAENAVFEAQAALDVAVAAKHRGGGSQRTVDDARAKLARLQDQLKEQQTELRRVEAQSGMPLPTQSEGQLNMARAELSGAQAALEKTHIRAPTDGTVLQVNARSGEMAGPTSTQPLLRFGNISKLRVRAEVDEADFAEIYLDAPVVVRATALPERELGGKLSFIAPILGRPRISAGKAENANVVEVFVELADPGPLVPGMKVDVYFMAQSQPQPTH
jgi:HlyD family secretion protein